MQDITYSGRKEDYHDLITKGYEFKLGDYISGGWNIAKQNIGGFMGFTFLFLSIVILFYAIIGGAIATLWIGNPTSPSPTAIAIAATISIITYLSLIIIMTITGCGYFIVADKINRQEPYTFSDFFGAFAHWKQLLTYSLINLGIMLLTMGPALVIMTIYFYIPLFQGDIRNPEDIQKMTSNIQIVNLFVIPAYYFIIAFSFSPLFIIFGKLTYWDAMTTSRKLITKNFLWYLLFYMILGAIMYLGVFAFLIGMFLSIPAAVCMIYFAYNEIVSKKTNTIDSKIDEIGIHDQPTYNWNN